ncbi:MAG: hypothetical protein UT09_C0022G0003 [Parcubacteria group bacterium GW2011_GWF2_38_8]|nr:MAG: hypothetical protein UT09_C0022G0003 [Parcubacteria group bacterium GW2011_GWF2_38_8]
MFKEDIIGAINFFLFLLWIFSTAIILFINVSNIILVNTIKKRFRKEGKSSLNDLVGLVEKKWYGAPFTIGAVYLKNKDVRVMCFVIMFIMLVLSIYLIMVAGYLPRGWILSTSLFLTAATFVYMHFSLQDIYLYVTNFDQT